MEAETPSLLQRKLALRYMLSRPFFSPPRFSFPKQGAVRQVEPCLAFIGLEALGFSQQPGCGLVSRRPAGGSEQGCALLQAVARPASLHAGWGVWQLEVGGATAVHWIPGSLPLPVSDMSSCIQSEDGYKPHLFLI